MQFKITMKNFDANHNQTCNAKLQFEITNKNCNVKLHLEIANQNCTQKS